MTNEVMQFGRGPHNVMDEVSYMLDLSLQEMPCLPRTIKIGGTCSIYNTAGRLQVAACRAYVLVGNTGQVQKRGK